MPKAAWQEGCASCPVSPAGQGDTAQAGGILGRGEKRGDSEPILGHRAVLVSFPSHFCSMEPARREAAGGGGGQLQCPPHPLHTQTCTPRPAAVRTGRRKAESRASAHLTLLPAACAPRFAALCRAASIAWSSPGFPSAASPAPRSHSGRGWESASALSSARIHPCIERPGRRRGGQCLVSPLASLSCYCPSKPTLTM